MKRILPLVMFLPGMHASAQFAPPAGEPGSTAMHADSSAFVAWATGCTVQRGPIDISNPAGGMASVGEEASALGPANGTGVVSLGDGGTATLTFAAPITNGPGWDFAVFENGSNTFLELAFVEVSSNGTDFHRFPATSNTQTAVQVGAFSELDATLLNDLAGKYRAQYGTPFHLDELASLAGLDVAAITHVRVVDVVGCIQEGYASVDQWGNKVNDPWSTPFASGGFDLDAVGVVHQQLPTGILAAAPLALQAVVFPNPASGLAQVRFTNTSTGPVRIVLADMLGVAVRSVEYAVAVAGEQQCPVHLGALPAGAYVLLLTAPDGHARLQLIVQ